MNVRQNQVKKTMNNIEKHEYISTNQPWIELEDEELLSESFDTTDTAADITELAADTTDTAAANVSQLQEDGKNCV